MDKNSNEPSEEILPKWQFFLMSFLIASLLKDLDLLDMLLVILIPCLWKQAWKFSTFKREPSF